MMTMHYYNLHYYTITLNGGALA